MPHDCSAHRDALPLTARELLGAAREVRSQVEELRGPRHPFLDHSLRGLPQAQPEGDVLGDAQVRIERVVLEHHGDVTFLRRQVVDHAPSDRELAVGDLLQAGDHAQRSRLPAAGRADQDEELAVVGLEREVLDRVDAVLVDLLDVLEHDLSHGCHRPFHSLHMENAGPSAGSRTWPLSSAASAPYRVSARRSRARRAGSESARAERGRRDRAPARIATRAGRRRRPRPRRRSGCRRARVHRLERRSAIRRRYSSSSTRSQVSGRPTASSAAHPLPTCPRARARRLRTASALPECSSAGRGRRHAEPSSRRPCRSAPCRGCRSSIHEWSTAGQATPGAERAHRLDGLAAVEPRRGRVEERVVTEGVRAQPPPDRAEEAGVVHDAVPATAAQVAAGVVTVLRDDETVRSCVVERPPQRLVRPRG